MTEEHVAPFTLRSTRLRILFSGAKLELSSQNTQMIMSVRRS